jgi:hypothetical protein
MSAKEQAIAIKYCKRGHPQTPDNLNKKMQCKLCARLSDGKWRKNNPEKERESSRQWRKNNPEKVRESDRKWKKNNLEKVREHCSQWKKNNVSKLQLYYIVQRLKHCGTEITPETMELKRQQITMKRTLKEFKKWRKENEPNNKDVHGKQQPNENNYEGQLQAG